MKTFEIRNKFGLDALTAVERPDPAPGPYEVLIKLQAVSLNFRDISVIKGFYNPEQSLPLIPLSDGVGKVIAVGNHVSRVRGPVTE